MGIDKVIPRHAYDRPFTVGFPDRGEWKDMFQPNRKQGLIWYTDGSKTCKGTGAGVFGYGTRRKLSFSLGKYTTVFQAEVYGIKECAVETLDKVIKTEIFRKYTTVFQAEVYAIKACAVDTPDRVYENILSDSHEVIKALYTRVSQ
jgi:hypothetical protein